MIIVVTIVVTPYLKEGSFQPKSTLFINPILSDRTKRTKWGTTISDDATDLSRVDQKDTSPPKEKKRQRIFFFTRGQPDAVVGSVWSGRCPAATGDGGRAIGTGRRRSGALAAGRAPRTRRRGTSTIRPYSASVREETKNQAKKTNKAPSALFFPRSQQQFLSVYDPGSPTGGS